jgi:hypothetical protein
MLYVFSSFSFFELPFFFRFAFCAAFDLSAHTNTTSLCPHTIHYPTVDMGTMCVISPYTSVAKTYIKSPPVYLSVCVCVCSMYMYYISRISYKSQQKSNSKRQRSQKQTPFKSPTRDISTRFKFYGFQLK